MSDPSDTCVITLWENQAKKGSDWVAYKKRPWVSEVAGTECDPPDEYKVPGPEWRWDCNWKVQFKNSGECDSDGWEYASKMARMYNGGSRTPRGEPKWSDKARRRLWRRVARRDVKKPIEIKQAIPKIQQNLSGVHNARMQVEAIIRTSPENASSPALQKLIDRVQSNIAELLHALDQLEDETVIAVDGQQYVAVIKKLRNDCLREEAALSKEGDRGRSSFRSSTGSRRGNTRRGSSLNRNERGSEGRASFGASPRDRDTKERDSDTNTNRSSMNRESSMRGSNSSLLTTSSAGEGNKRGVLNMKSNSSSGLPQLATPEFGSIHGGLENKWDDDFADQAGTAASGGTGIMDTPEEGVFVDRAQHTQMMEQKLVPVDEGTIMQDIINERNEEIEQMHKGLVEVNSMFIDLGMLVKEQGDSIQLIFENTEKAKDTAGEAMSNVQKAERLQTEGCVIS